MSYNGKGLTPIFHSELSSSYLLFDIFYKHNAIAADFIKEYYDLDVDKKGEDYVLQVKREKSIWVNGKKIATIDLFITFTTNDNRCALPIEIKIHDYTSVAEGQINRYHRAVKEDQPYHKTYFIYLTQFNKKIDDFMNPRTLDEAVRGKKLIGPPFRHLTWENVHEFLEKHLVKLSREQKVMVDLHRSWIVYNGEADLATNASQTGERSLEYYLGDVSEARTVLEPLGKKVQKKKYLKLIIDLNDLDDVERDAVLKGIRLLVNSESVDKDKQFPPVEHTMQSMAVFLSEMEANNERDLLGFYTVLFDFASETSFLKLYSTGNTGFSIKLKVIDKDEISLCTLWKKNKLVTFSWIR